MRLVELVAKANLQGLGLLRELRGDPATEVGVVTMDSRDSRLGGPATLFACVPGQISDGHRFAPEAVGAGAAALLTEHPLDLGAPEIVVTSVREALGPLCDALYWRPSSKMTVAGVTGTNGKTTTCAFLGGIFEAGGWPSITVGTLTQTRTTPEAPELQALLAGWHAQGGRAAAMEVSSHALEQHRVDGVHFAAGVFTNLTPEHLDYHHTMDAYFEAKAKMFDPSRPGGPPEIAVVNAGDEWGSKLIDRVKEHGSPVATFDQVDVTDVVLEPRGSSFTWRGRPIRIAVAGRFNVMNALAAATCAGALGIEADAIVGGLGAVAGVAGRFELVEAGQPFTVVVDYAHTPDGLAKVIDAAREVCSGRLIVVFGAGGDRDHEKRPMMGEVASTRADLAVVTSDNPRGEDPQAVIDEVLSGRADRAKVSIQVDRRLAITDALSMARPGDVVVIAGKGHEKGQEIAGRVLPFDDVEVAREALVRIRASRQVGE